MRRPFAGTIAGAALGLVAIGVWAATFAPHGGSDYSWYLFPISRLILNWLYPHQSISPLLWFGGAWLQWLLLGAVIDVARRIDHARKRTRK